MNIFLILLCGICVCLFWAYTRLREDIFSLCGQLEEIMQGSHMELAVNSRQKCLLALCKKLNQVLSCKDANHLQYEQAERRLKQDITNLAHDIRTPLTGASGYLQLARESNSFEKREHYLQRAENRLAELSDMLEKLFLYTKLTGEDFSLPPESMKEIQVLPLLGDCLLSFYTQFEKAGTVPKLIFESEDIRVYAEEEALRRIFQNLIQNALLHGTGEITVFQNDASSVVKDVSPNTSTRTYLIFENPVPADCFVDTVRIFDRFYKADTARRKGSSGLGLFIVKELMRKMNGDAIVETLDNRLRIILVFYK